MKSDWAQATSKSNPAITAANLLTASAGIPSQTPLVDSTQANRSSCDTVSQPSKPEPQALPGLTLATPAPTPSDSDKRSESYEPPPMPTPATVVPVEPASSSTLNSSLRSLSPVSDLLKSIEATSSATQPAPRPRVSFALPPNNRNASGLKRGYNNDHYHYQSSTHRSRDQYRPA